MGLWLKQKRIPLQLQTHKKPLKAYMAFSGFLSLVFKKKA
ncbi:hypothetical protein JCM19538_2285 [Jejuia pallidilutea]|uniref:Uncharacterized protein n=1 Tax=Jejuia pallidilutea TaxID=504487 RepID=A0A098LNJ8_9FLAO|nr:hypothetical protein JCM19538_2285 [Jejuia pallidilutea]